EVLLAAGADADAAETRRGTTALHLAAFRGHREVIDVLLTYGAGVDVADENGETPLFWAIGSGETEAIIRLVNAGADVNHRNRAGVDPLGVAAFAYDRESTERLLKMLGAVK
ncbi:MAG: ankyrin repeat domain-containing protein, partial [Gammaproteobacteria bacterium]